MSSCLQCTGDNCLSAVSAVSTTRNHRKIYLNPVSRLVNTDAAEGSLQSVRPRPQQPHLPQLRSHHTTGRQNDNTTTLNQCIKFYHSAAVAAAVVVRRVEEEVLAGEEGLVLPVRGLRHQLASPGGGACPPSPPSTSASVFAGKMF